MRIAAMELTMTNCTALSSHKRAPAVITKTNLFDLIPDTYDLRPGTTVNVGCASNLKLVGDHTLACLANGQWNYTSKPYCKELEKDSDDAWYESTRNLIIVCVIWGVAAVVFLALLVKIIAILIRKERNGDLDNKHGHHGGRYVHHGHEHGHQKDHAHSHHGHKHSHHREGHNHSHHREEHDHSHHREGHDHSHSHSHDQHKQGYKHNRDELQAEEMFSDEHSHFTGGHHFARSDLSDTLEREGHIHDHHGREHGHHRDMHNQHVIDENDSIPGFDFQLEEIHRF